MSQLNLSGMVLMQIIWEHRNCSCISIKRTSNKQKVKFYFHRKGYEQHPVCLDGMIAALGVARMDRGAISLAQLGINPIHNIIVGLLKEIASVLKIMVSNIELSRCKAATMLMNHC